MLNTTKLSQNLPWKIKRYLLGLIIFIFSYAPKLVTAFYQPYVFKPISFVLRTITGKIQFAIGEWVYLIICIALIINVFKWIWTNYVQFTQISFWLEQLVKILNGLVTIYILFQLVWGLNYQKPSPALDFKMAVSNSYTEEQMDSLSLNLIQEMNQTRTILTDSAIKLVQFDSILEQTKLEYDLIDKDYAFLHYRRPSLKRAIFPIWGDYFGYTAFYQPLTGEAIIRDDLPILTQAFTVSHEMAHQLGYASETEANFIAYVIGRESKSALFNYSTQLQLFSYAQMAQLNSIAKRGDFKQFKIIIERNKQLMHPKVLADRKFIRDFFMHKQALLIPGSTQLYNQFLQWNKQAKGIESYNDVLLWALAYKKLPKH